MVLTAHLAVDAIHERPEVMAHIAILHHIGRKVHRERLEVEKRSLAAISRLRVKKHPMRTLMSPMKSKSIVTERTSSALYRILYATPNSE